MADAGKFPPPRRDADEYRRSHVLDFCTYLFYRAISSLLSLFPLRFLYSLGEFFGLIAWSLLGSYRSLEQRNLVLALDLSESEARALTLRHFKRLGANLLSSVKLGRKPLDQIAECVALENADEVHHTLRSGRPVVLTLSHMGSWELFAQLFPKYFSYVPLSTIYQPLGNRFIDADVRKMRARAGVKLLDRREGFQNAIAMLRKG